MKNQILFLVSIIFLFVAFSCKSKSSMLTSNFSSNYQYKVQKHDDCKIHSNFNLVEKGNLEIEKKQEKKVIQTQIKTKKNKITNNIKFTKKEVLQVKLVKKLLTNFTKKGAKLSGKEKPKKIEKILKTLKWIGLAILGIIITLLMLSLIHI